MRSDAPRTSGDELGEMGDEPVARLDDDPSDSVPVRGWSCKRLGMEEVGHVRGWSWKRLGMEEVGYGSGWYGRGWVEEVGYVRGWYGRAW